MTQVAEQTDRTQFLADFDALTDKTTPPWIADLRNEGAAVFSGMEFPSYKEEAWRNTDIRPILRTGSREYLYKEHDLRRSGRVLGLRRR